MDLSRIRIFHTVAQLGNISRTAEKLCLSQSTVSRAMMELEQSLGSKLVNRTSRGITLTAQGERVFTFSKKISQEANLFEKLFHEQEEEQNEAIQGEIKIATLPYFGANWLVPQLKNFIEKNNKIKANIILKTEGIDLSDSDVAIRSFIPNQPGLIQKHIETIQMRLFASKEYLKKLGTPKCPQDLDNHQLIACQKDLDIFGNSTWHLQIGRQKEQPLRQPFLEITTVEGMIQAALDGFGITTIHTYSKISEHSHILSRGLVEVLPDVQGPEFEVYLIFPEERLHSKKLTQLAEYFKTPGQPH